MTYVIQAILDFLMSLAAVVVALHFDLEGYWQARHVRRGQRIEKRAAARRPPPAPRCTCGVEGGPLDLHAAWCPVTSRRAIPLT